MKTQNSEPKEKPNLTAALRILQNAGIKDLRLLSEDPDVQIQFIINALCDLSIHDGLTGLANAPFFHAVLAREIDRGLRTGRTCALMVVDIDHFKKINDTYGRNTGDEVLRSIAARMKLNLRGMDTAARIGGDTFANILPECETENAIRAATRIHSALSPLAVRIKQNTINQRRLQYRKQAA